MLQCEGGVAFAQSSFASTCRIVTGGFTFPIHCIVVLYNLSDTSVAKLFLCTFLAVLVRFARDIQLVNRLAPSRLSQRPVADSTSRQKVAIASVSKVAEYIEAFHRFKIFIGEKMGPRGTNRRSLRSIAFILVLTLPYIIYDKSFPKSSPRYSKKSEK